MGLFEKKTDKEKQQREEMKDAKQDARQDERDARQDAREDKRDARKDARGEKHDARELAREEKQGARQEKRDELKSVRRSDLAGETKRDAKQAVREDKRDVVRGAREGKRDAIDIAGHAKRERIDEVEAEKDEALDAIREEELEALAAIAAPARSVINATLALELLALTHAAQFQDAGTLTANPEVSSTMPGAASPFLFRGATLRNPTAITGRTFKSDTECFVARSDADDLVVAFRGSETALFDKVGAFKDWALTDFRANRMAYPPAPKSWPDQRWVHAGFWQAYDLVRNPLLAEVSRQATKGAPARRIFVTGFSMGGALALLAALDIAQGLPDMSVELFTFAAPRAGDASLNKLLAQRVKRSTVVAYRGDPVVHLPPFGPNFPVTLKNPISVDLAGIHIPLGNALPQAGQQYVHADRLVYIDKDDRVQDRFPTAQVALRFMDHEWEPYRKALDRIARAQEPDTTETATAAG